MGDCDRGGREGVRVWVCYRLRGGVQCMVIRIFVCLYFLYSFLREEGKRGLERVVGVSSYRWCVAVHVSCALMPCGV